MLQAKPHPSQSQLQPTTAALKSSTLLVLLLLMLTLGRDGQGVALANQAAAANAPGEALRARSVYEDATEPQTKVLGEKTGNNEKNLRFTGPINEVSAKRLKLIFLLMMSQGQSRTPNH